ncbi:MAG: ribbon-helix-helix protein, CopG family [Planctomycetes bacterium]|nr:ribbon-helix-helix protein, CopG family [Planctomycetota bacterium]
MKTTVDISDSVMQELEQEAARQGCTMSELVETALRALLQKRPPARKLPPLPEFDMGEALVDIADRNALYEAMEE